MPSDLDEGARRMARQARRRLDAHLPAKETEAKPSAHVSARIQRTAQVTQARLTAALARRRDRAHR